MAWGKAGSTTLSSAGDLITVDSLSNNKCIMILNNVFSSGQGKLEPTLNNDTGSNYAIRYELDGAAEVTLTSQPDFVNTTGGFTNGLTFHVQYLVNIATEEKLLISHSCEIETTGAGTAPRMREYVGKWANTSDAVSRYDVPNVGTGDFASGSNSTLIGSDITPAAAVPALDNVQDNSLFVDKVNARRYWFDADAKSNVELTTGAPFTTHSAGWDGRVYASELEDLPNVGDVVTGGKIYVGTSAGNVRLGLYSDNGSGVPQTLLAETASTAVGSAGAWQEIDFITPYTTTSTGKLHLGLQTDSSSSGFGYAVNVINGRSSMVTSYSAFPTTFSGTSDNAPADLRAVVERDVPTWTKQNPELPTVSGLYVHYDATDVNSITKDSNNRISQWNDKSGGERHLTQATSGNQPLWIASDEAGNPVIDFSDDRYMSDTWSAQSLPNTIFIVARLPVSTASRTNIISGSGSNAQSVFGDGSNTWKYAAGSAQGGTKTGIEDTWQYIYALYGDDYTFEIGGELITGTACGSDTWIGMTVGASSAVSQFGNMKIGEIIGYNVAVKGADKTAIINYLKEKWERT